GGTLENSHDCFRLADFKATWGFDTQVSDFAVFGDQSVALATPPHAAGVEVEFKANRFGEGGGAIGQHGYLLTGTLVLAPGPHNKCIIDGDAGDGIDSLGLQSLRVLHKAGQMLGAAGWREGTRHREKHYFLSLEDLIRRDLLRAIRRCNHQLHGRYGI